MRQRVCELARAFDVIGPSEHLVDDVHVAKQIGDDAMVGLALDVVEQHRAAAIEMLLQSGDLEIGVDRLVGLDQIAACLEPFECVAKGRRPLTGLRIFLAGCLLHCLLLQRPRIARQTN